MRNRVLLLCIVSVLLLVPRVNWAAEKCFLNIDGIRGESQDAQHKDWIDIESWSWGESNTGNQSVGGGGGAGKTSPQDFHFVMRMSIASPSILRRCSTGEHIQVALLECWKDTGKTQYDYLKILFQEVFISSYQTSSSGQNSVGSMDQISFNFAKILLEYRQLQSNGTVGGPAQFGFDYKQNQSMYPDPITGSGSGAPGGGSSSGGAVSGQVPPAATSPVQTPVKTTPSTISPKIIKMK